MKRLPSTVEERTSNSKKVTGPVKCLPFVEKRRPTTVEHLQCYFGEVSCIFPPDLRSARSLSKDFSKASWFFQLEKSSVYLPACRME